jgi:S-formylglutathione hydrolase
LDQYIYNIKKLTAIGFDAGDKDMAIAASIRSLDTSLNEYDIKHSFEIYNGMHTSHVADRIKNKMLQFFGKNLSFQQN